MKTTLRGSATYRIANPHNPGVEIDFVSENDIVLSDGEKNRDIVCVFGRPAVINVCEACINTNRGEIQLAITRGVPYLRGTLGGIGQDAISDWASFAQATIMDVPGVTGIRSFSYDIVGVGGRRALSYTAKIETKYDDAGEEMSDTSDSVVTGMTHTVTAVDGHR